VGRRPSHPRARRCCGPSSLSPPVVSSLALLWAVVPLATCCLYSTLLWAVIPLVTCHLFFNIIVHYSYFFLMIPLHPPLDTYIRSLVPPPSHWWFVNPCSPALLHLPTLPSNPIRLSPPILLWLLYSATPIFSLHHSVEFVPQPPPAPPWTPQMDNHQITGICCPGSMSALNCGSRSSC
jgi:hypothetical protein